MMKKNYHYLLVFYAVCSFNNVLTIQTWAEKLRHKKN